MKKIIYVLIIVLGVSFVLTGCFEVTPQNSGDKEPEIVLENTFHGYSIEEWEEMIEEYFFEGEYDGQKIKASCKFDDSGNFTADVLSNSFVLMSFVFDDETGYAKDTTFGLEMDFVNGKYVNLIKNQKDLFSDNLCLGIASITKENEEATIDKYFKDRTLFDHITRLNLNNGMEYIDRFLIIPKDESVTFDIYSVKLTDEGTIEPEFEVDMNIKEPIIFTCDDYESTMPQYGIKLKSNGFEDFIPLSFSGYDGSLVLSGHESEVIDLTIYE